jgi:hypothetical protein
MDVAMRQFGIALLVVHEDDGEQISWPYTTQNFLQRLGSGYFLPLTFGIIHVLKDGSLSILRKQIGKGSPVFSVPCYWGYALDMKNNIRDGGKVNLIKGLFDVSYTTFADYISKPTACKGKRNFPSVRDYRTLYFRELEFFKNEWDSYQDWVQDSKRRNNKKREEAKGRAKQDKAKKPPKSTAKGAGEPTLQANEEIDEDNVGERMSPEHNLSSYAGNTEEDKQKNRNWFHNDYQAAWPGKAEMEDLTGQKKTLDQSLRLWGRTIKTEDDCDNLFNDERRFKKLEKIGKTWRALSRTIDTDNFKKRVLDEGMRKVNMDKFSALNMAREALIEWDREAKKLPQQQMNKGQLDNLHSWEGEIYVYQTKKFLDYDTYKKTVITKKRKTS